MNSDFTLIGVYDADGTPLGEVRYWVGARLGRSHCSLCEITHGLFREKSTWRECRAAIDVEFTTFHRDDAPGDVLAAIAGQFRVVVARTKDGVVVVLSREELAPLQGDTERFVSVLEASCDRLGLGSISR